MAASGTVAAPKAPAATAEAASPAPSSRHLPALDGLRGIAVLLVMCFHVGIGLFRGGFVGVTVFFTLSGFLICSRSLVEIDRSQGFSPVRFFERRIRRLAPASLLCLGITGILVHYYGSVQQQRSIGGDTLAAAANVANWRFLLHGTSYSDLFAAPSPLEHYWSLAIEEQFYLLFPVVVLLLLLLPRRVRPVITGVLLAALVTVSVRACFVAGSFDRFYYGTDARMIEILVGVVLALLVGRPAMRQSLSLSRHRRWLGPLGAVALGGIIASALTFRNASPAYQHGGGILVALLTGLLIVGLLDAGSPVGRLCSLRPLVWTGKVSYGAYLYHWPIVAIFGHRWGPLHGLPLSLLQIVVSLAAAGASYHLFESKVMQRRTVPAPRQLMRAWSATLAGVVALALALVATGPPASAARFGTAGSGFSLPSKLTPHHVPVQARPGAPRPMRVVVAGDSTATVMANALIRYQDAHPGSLDVLDLSMPGCTVTIVQKVRHYQGESGQDMSKCGLWPFNIPEKVRAFHPDVTVVFVSMMEQADEELKGSSTWESVLDPAWRQRQDHDFGILVNDLNSTGAPVLWATAPYGKFQPDLPWISDAPDRTDALNGLFRELAAQYQQVTLINYAAQLNQPDHHVDTSIRPDGIHMTDAASDRVTSSWLMPLLEARSPDSARRQPAS